MRAATGLVGSVGSVALLAAALLVAPASMTFAAPPGDDADTHVREVESYRQARETRMRGATGWLSLAGLFWLDEGAHRFGADSKNALVLPPSGGMPAHAGTLTLKDGVVSVRLEPKVTATIGGKPVTGVAALRPDDPGPPDMLVLGPVSVQIIRRADRLGVRVRDAESPARRAFTGLRWFPIRASYRVTARFVPVDKPQGITVPSAVGPAQTLPCAGTAIFTLDGHEHRLDAIKEEPTADELFFIFRDKTSGAETYGAGRFLYTPLPRDGQVVLDFNKAFSPPCAFTPYATCPLPPPQNRLPIRLEAGELQPHVAR